MIMAVLFNWRAYPTEKNYWHEARKAVFGSGVLQRSGRHMKLSIGDVMTGLQRGQDPEKIYTEVFGASELRIVDEDRLIEAFPTIFGMVFENIPRALASELNDALCTHDGYVGILSVHFEYGPHLALFRSRLPPRYRIHGARLRAFYSMGDTEGCDRYDLDEFRGLGYEDVTFEDYGAHRTIFDDYDTQKHFRRVALFRELLTTSRVVNEDDAYELTMMLEDLSPRLFNSLGAATERLSNAETEEEFAQVAISGRRYLEQLADALFPPVKTANGKRKLDKSAYKNRLWAFVEAHTRNNPRRLIEIGKEIDRIVLELNGGLHSDRPKARVALSIADVAVLTATLFSLDPDAIRNGYLAFEDTLRAFVQSLAKED